MRNSSSLPNTLPIAVSNSPDILEDAGACVLVRDALESPVALPGISGILDAGFQVCRPATGCLRNKATDLVSSLEAHGKVAIGTIIAKTVGYRVCMHGHVACVL